MNDVLKRLSLWVWHLLPANPILVRVVQGGSRRSRHLWLRLAYLTILLMVVSFSLISSPTGSSGSLTDLAKGASQTFKWASITQLALICFLAPTFAASAITQERDAQTYNILLSTPLTSAQIVFGSLLSRLFFVIALLVAGLPIFLMTMLYGGVTTSGIVESFMLSGSTAALTGSLAIFVAMMGVGSRRTIFSFYLLIALYLLLVYLLGSWSATWVEQAPANISNERMSWLAPLHPFLSLNVSLNIVRAPTYEQLAGHSSIVRYALANPSTFYMLWTSALAFMLTVVSILLVRKCVKTGEATLLSKLSGGRIQQPDANKTQAPRNVWRNPVAWREAKTRTTAGGWIRWLILGLGIAASIGLFYAYSTSLISGAELGTALAAITLIQLVLALLIATNTAATSMTKEKEAKTIDLLLTTLLTSRYILWGKLRGLVSFCVPLLGGPVLVIAVFGLVDLLGAKPIGIGIEASIELAALMVTYTALACVLALQISLKSKTNMVAVMSSMGMLILLLGLASLVAYAIVQASGGGVGAFFAPFAPFTAVMFLVNPAELFSTPAEFMMNRDSTRVTMLVGSIIACAVYSLIVYNLYASLVRGFDMTLRKQSGQ